MEQGIVVRKRSIQLWFLFSSSHVKISLSQVFISGCLTEGQVYFILSAANAQPDKPPPSEVMYFTKMAKGLSAGLKVCFLLIQFLWYAMISIRVSSIVYWKWFELQGSNNFGVGGLTIFVMLCMCLYNFSSYIRLLPTGNRSSLSALSVSPNQSCAFSRVCASTLNSILNSGTVLVNSLLMCVIYDFNVKIVFMKQNRWLSKF